MIVHPLELVSDSECHTCGSTAWIVDGDGAGRHWLLCVDVYDKGCVETRKLSDEMVVDRDG